jgi:hypothetical protein
MEKEEQKCRQYCVGEVSMESYQTCNLIPNSNRPEGLTRNRLKKKKGNVVPVLIKHSAMNACVGLEVQFHEFLISALMGVNWDLHTLAFLPVRKKFSVPVKPGVGNYLGWQAISAA